MKNYTIKSIENNLIDPYVNEYGGQLTVVKEGVVGLGTLILHDAPNKRNIVIKEFFINSWTSGHSVRQYNKLPRKYKKMIEV